MAAKKCSCGRNNVHPWFPSFPRSAWECTSGTLRVQSLPRPRLHCVQQDATQSVLTCVPTLRVGTRSNAPNQRSLRYGGDGFGRGTIGCCT
jgi:hypothetical protein